MAHKRKQAVGYLRTSSATNVGPDKDSAKRQRRAIERLAKRQGYLINEADWFYDPAVRGDKDPIETRKGFAAMLNRIEDNGVRVVLIEDVTRFAREVKIQELGIDLLVNLGVQVITADGTDLTELDDPEKVAMRQMRGVFSQLEKGKLVAKLRVARERIRAETGKCEGRKSYAERDPQMVALAQYLRGGHDHRPYSLRAIAADLAAYGYTTPSGKPYSASAVQSMLEAA